MVSKRQQQLEKAWGGVSRIGFERDDDDDRAGASSSSSRFFYREINTAAAVVRKLEWRLYLLDVCVFARVISMPKKNGPKFLRSVPHAKAASLINGMIDFKPSLGKFGHECAKPAVRFASLIVQIIST